MEVSVALVVVSDDFVPVAVFGTQLMISAMATRNLAKRLGILKSIFDSFVGIFQRFGQDACLSQGGHEIRVSVPARDDVHVDMSQHTRAASLPNVRADVEALRLVNIFQNGCTAGCKFHHLGTRFGSEFFERSDMLKWIDHDMSACVRVAVENDIDTLAAIYDEILHAVLHFLRYAKGASIFFVVFQIFHTPG